MDDSLRRKAHRHVLPPEDALEGGDYSIVRTWFKLISVVLSSAISSCSFQSR